MTEYERTLVRNAKTAMENLSIDPDDVSITDRRWIMSYVVGAADNSHIRELYEEAVACDVHRARIGIVFEFRDIESSLDYALSDAIAEQLRPIVDAAIEELRASTAAADLRELEARDYLDRKRDLDEEARRAGL